MKTRWTNRIIGRHALIAGVVVSMVYFITGHAGSTYEPIYGGEELMSRKAFGTCSKPIQAELKFKASGTTAEEICCNNRDYAEYRGYFVKTEWEEEVRSVGDRSVEYYDSSSGKVLFVAPVGRSAKSLLLESEAHGWPSFRDEEVNWDNVRVLGGGEVVSIDGTHLGHNIPDFYGNRYCIK